MKVIWPGIFRSAARQMPHLALEVDVVPAHPGGLFVAALPEQ
jgi:hypothetical protein